MKLPKLNWPVWAGFLLSIIAFLSYFFVFVWFPVTRDFPWANFLLFAAAAALVLLGLRRAFTTGRPRRAKLGGGVLAVLSFTILGLFLFMFFVFARQLPASKGAPQVGQQAPEFTLTDTDGKPVSLSGLLASRDAQGKTPKGVLLVFYRGYW